MDTLAHVEPPETAPVPPQPAPDPGAGAAARRSALGPTGTQAGAGSRGDTVAAVTSRSSVGGYQARSSASTIQNTA